MNQTTAEEEVLRYCRPQPLVQGAEGSCRSGPFAFENGERLDSMTVGFVTHGQLNARRDNAVLLLPGTTNTRHSADGHIGPGKAFDPEPSRANFRNVPYKGSTAAITDVLGGHVQLSIDTAMAATPQISAGKIKALGVTSATRTSVLPSVPSFAESGLPGFSLVAWNVWFAPRGTPPAIVEKLNVEIAKVLAEPDTAAKLRGLGYEPGQADDPQKVSAFVNAETKKWGDLIRAAGITAD